MPFPIRALLVAATVACLSVPGAAVALDDWNTVVAKAKQEGLVVVHGAPGRRHRPPRDNTRAVMPP